MFQAFPSIRREGEKEWSFFIKCLSQRIRHLRWAEKKKTQPEKRRSDGNHGDADSHATKSPRVARILCGSSGSAGLQLSDEDYEHHLTEIQREWAKGNTRNSDHLNLLLQECFQRNQQWIKSLPDSKMEPILKKLPCYTDGSVVTGEFRRLIGAKQFDEMLDKSKVFMSTVETLISSPGQEPERMIPVIHHVERATAFDKGRGIKTKEIITVKEDIPDEEIESSLKSCDKEPPHLLVLKTDGNLKAVFVIGDGVHIRCKETVTDALITLIAVYYVFDLEYPKIYSQLLGTLQSHIVPGVPFEGKKSAKYKVFSTVLQRKMVADS